MAHAVTMFAVAHAVIATVASTAEIVEFRFQRQLRTLNDANGVKEILPMGPLSAFNLTLSRNDGMDDGRIMRSADNLQTLLGWCMDEEESLRVDSPTNVIGDGRQVLQAPGSFHYHKPSLDALPLSAFPNDYDLLEANVFSAIDSRNATILVVFVGFAAVPYGLDRKRHRQQIVAKYFTCCHGHSLIKYPPCDCAIDAKTCSVPCYRMCTPYQSRSLPFKVHVWAIC